MYPNRTMRKETTSSGEALLELPEPILEVGGFWPSWPPPPTHGLRIQESKAVPQLVFCIFLNLLLHGFHEVLGIKGACKQFAVQLMASFALLG